MDARGKPVAQGLRFSAGTPSCRAAVRALRQTGADLALFALTTSPGVMPDGRELAAAGHVLAVPKRDPLRFERWLATRRAA